MDWLLLDSDRELFDRELDDFVPTRIFDAHAHLYDVAHFGTPPALCASGPPTAGWNTFTQRIADITPGRTTSGLFFAMPNVTLDIPRANAFLRDEVRHDAASRAQMIITPDMSAEFVREKVQTNSFVGLKCYHLYSPEKPTWESSIDAFLPAEQMQVAHDLGLTITLHIVKSRALADRVNQETLREYGRLFPNAKIILAHAARGFNPHHTVLGIDSLKGVPNLWFDTSAVTDSGAFEAIVQAFGHERLLYGSDFPITHIRGRCVAVGDSFLWLTPDNTNLHAAYAQLQFTLVGLDSLRTLKLAALNLRLSDSQIEDIFWGNAAGLYGI